MRGAPGAGDRYQELYRDPAGEADHLHPEGDRDPIYAGLQSRQVFTREQLLNRVWGYDFAGETRTVDTHIKRIRAKLDNTGLNWSIKTIYGVGYKFEVE